jgi:isopenicillin-N N-acyltransferase like protein
MMQPTVRASGNPFQRGGVVGEALADDIARSVAFNRRYLTSHGLDQRRLSDLLDPYLEASTHVMPHLVEQIRGMADGADCSFLDLFFANAFEEVYGIVDLTAASSTPLERCTDVVLRSAGRTLLGHNEQWYAGDDGAVGLILDISDDGPAVLAPVVAGTLPLVGMNEHGAAFGTMSLSARDERVGVPRALVARSLLEAANRDEALLLAAPPERAGGYSYLCAFPGGDHCVIETTATTSALLDLDVHTNHALDPSVATVACDASTGSRARLTRARELAPSATASVEGLAALLADHAGAAQDICVHPDPALGDEGSTILFSMICEPETHSMWLAAGHPCTSVFERVQPGQPFGVTTDRTHS